MREKAEDISGILAYITTSKDRYLGGAPLAILVKDQDEMLKISDAIAEAFMADILHLANGDSLILKS